MTKVSPSMLSADFSRLGAETERVDAAGADWIHLDVMDGMFVPNITFGPPVVKSIRRFTDRPFDAHLMIEDPARYIDAFAGAGCDSITVHCEASGDIGAAVRRIDGLGLSPGMSLNPETPLEEISPWLPYVDIVLVMTVHPGFGGQSFIPECVEKISALSAWAENNNPGLEISVDGGVNAETARICVDAGATVLVAGSYLFKMKDMAPTVAEWQALGPNAGRSDGSQSLADRRGAGDRTAGPQRHHGRRGRVQHHLPVPLHHTPAGRQAALRRRGQRDLAPLRTSVQDGQPHRERHRAGVRLRRETERAQGRDHRRAHRPQGEGDEGV